MREREGRRWRGKERESKRGRKQARERDRARDRKTERLHSNQASKLATVKSFHFQHTSENLNASV